MHCEMCWDLIQARPVRYLPPLFVGDSVDCIAMSMRASGRLNFM
jgi:hypothetical protein